MSTLACAVRPCPSLPPPTARPLARPRSLAPPGAPLFDRSLIYGAILKLPCMLKK